MSSVVQTVIAFVIVALAALVLVRSFLKKRQQPGCGSACGAVSPEIRKLRSRMRG